jgi:cytosine/uracil/thiamine/allantoin permease
MSNISIEYATCFLLKVFFFASIATKIGMEVLSFCHLDTMMVTICFLMMVVLLHSYWGMRWRLPCFLHTMDRHAISQG